MASKEEHLMTCDEIIKACGSMDDKEKVKYFAAMYDKLHKLHKNLQFCYNTTKREASSLNADKNKLVLVQSRLESLCRELQKQNKTITDESLMKIREEEERRKQISQEFQKTLNNVTTMMTESNAQNTKLGEENRQMAERLASIYEEFKTRENEVERISKQIDIERQLAEARCAKMKTEFMIEKQTLLAEKDELNQKIALLTKELLDSTKKSTLHELRIVELTTKLESYSGKYEEFENTITKSGKVFDHCKAEITRMNKQINTLEKEIAQWQSRYRKNMTTIQELQSESNEKTKVIEYVTKKQNQLTKLCRQLNSERKAYINVLRELGKNPSDITIEAPVDDEPEIEDQQPSIKFLPPAHASSIEEKTKQKKSHQDQSKKKQRGKKGKEIPETIGSVPMTLKEIHLAELKEELQRVQDQVSKMQLQATTTKQECETIIVEEDDAVAKEVAVAAGTILIEKSDATFEKEQTQNEMSIVDAVADNNGGANRKKDEEDVNDTASKIHETDKISTPTPPTSQKIDEASHVVKSEELPEEIRHSADIFPNTVEVGDSVAEITKD